MIHVLLIILLHIFCTFGNIKKGNRKSITLLNFQKYKKYGEVSLIINISLIIAIDILLLYIIISGLRNNLIQILLYKDKDNKKNFFFFIFMY